MNKYLSFLVIFSFSAVLSNDAHTINEFDRLEQIEYRLHNNLRDEVAYINASSFTDWAYFSFELNDVIDIDNPESSLDWDMAFRRNHIRTNSGLSGPGQGGGYVNSEESWLDNWETLNSVPNDAVWQVDESMCCYYDITTHEFTLTVIKNPALDQWGDFNDSQQFVYTNYVMFVKGADGEAAKFWPYDYYATSAGGGHIDIRYDLMNDDSSEDCAGVEDGDALVDDCGDCQQSYCYDYVTHAVNFDADYACDGATEMSVVPDSPSNPYWNAGCTDCTGAVNGDALVDDCGDCQQSYCYDYVTHAVNFDADYACDGATEMSVVPDSPSNPYWNDGCIICEATGDFNQDGDISVSDIVLMVAHILGVEGALSYNDCGDINSDGVIRVDDIVLVVNFILGVDNGSTDARLDSSSTMLKGETLSLTGDVSAVQMTLLHGTYFSIELSSAMVSKHVTRGNETTLIVVMPEAEEIFKATGEYEVAEVTAYNSRGDLINVSEPSSFSLSAAYPNPFNPSTSLNISMPVEGYVSVKAYNLMGQVVSILHEGAMNVGDTTLDWNASELPSGVYLITAEYAGNVTTQKVMLIK